jgi:hypothetical protein
VKKTHPNFKMWIKLNNEQLAKQFRLME